MKARKEWVYRCDHCGKAGRSKGHMRNHEIHCTKNPDRSCGMCLLIGEGQEPIADLIAAIGDDDENAIKRLEHAANGCSACMLAAINQAPWLRPQQDQESGPVKWHAVNDFDFKTHKKALLQEVAIWRAEDNYGGYASGGGY